MDEQQLSTSIIPPQPSSPPPLGCIWKFVFGEGGNPGWQPRPQDGWRESVIATIPTNTYDAVLHLVENPGDVKPWTRAWQAETCLKIFDEPESPPVMSDSDFMRLTLALMGYGDRIGIHVQELYQFVHVWRRGHKNIGRDGLPRLAVDIDPQIKWLHQTCMDCCERLRIAAGSRMREQERPVQHLLAETVAAVPHADGPEGRRYLWLDGVPHEIEIPPQSWELLEFVFGKDNVPIKQVSKHLWPKDPAKPYKDIKGIVHDLNTATLPLGIWWEKPRGTPHRLVCKKRAPSVGV